MNVVAAKAKSGAKSTKKKTKKPPEVKIIENFCKGCGICVAFCPTQVLEMEGGKAKVVHPEKCIACNFCELRCPDFAIAVYPAEG